MKSVLISIQPKWCELIASGKKTVEVRKTRPKLEMKKVFAIILCVVMISTTLAGCGNMSVGFGSFTYEKVHIDTHHYSGCLTIEKWYESESGIEVKTEERGSVFLSEGTYILLEGGKGCPLCEGRKDGDNNG